ncbi:MAG: ABC transporter ATP-binding protein [Ruminococcaceae bacterium]|nr:ABC transporter ATP-binding protein [Oscillospiraceae bacterium]
MIRKLAKSIREYKVPSIITLLLMVGEAGIECLIPFITANLINNISAGAPVSEIAKTGAMLVGMALVSLACGGTAGFTCAKASSGFAKNLRHDLFSAVQSFAFENIDKFSSSSLVTRLTTDVTNVQMSYMMLIRTAIRSPLMFTFSIIMAYRMGGALATTFVVVVPILIFGLLMVARNAMPAFRRVFKKYDRLNESIEENVMGIRVVKGFSREDFEKQKFDTAAEDICADFTKAERIVAFNMPLMQFCSYFNMAFVLLVGSMMAITSRGTTVNVGHISAMLTYGMQILMSLMMLSMIYVMLTMSLESMKRICEVLDQKPAIASPEDTGNKVQDGSIDFEGVNFSYARNKNNLVLKNINLHIDSGLTVGIIGGTGSSKSTLTQLIPRLYDANTGIVKVGGIDVKEYDIKTLRDAVSFVLQKNQLFSGTIKDNLRWGNENATDEQMVAACRMANADEFIRSFPDGYDTYIEQGGTNVSGGQRQRLCIARALLKNPKILILDDSTSAVDTRTDAGIRAELKKFIPETTKIIIAQRISSVMDADMIIVMDKGEISAVGTHSELLKTSDIYREVYEQQIHTGEDE